MSVAGLGLVPFIQEACRALGIALRAVGPREYELSIPPGLRRTFGGADTIRATDDPELRQHDERLELLAPGGFVVDSLVEILRQRTAGLQRLVAGVPAPLDIDACRTAFGIRFLASEEAMGPQVGKLPSGHRLVDVRMAVGLRETLRIFLDVRILGPNPVHEVFPVLVDMDRMQARPSHELGRRALYDVASLRGLAVSSPPMPDPVRLEVALAVALSTAKATIERLSGIARGGADEEIALRQVELASYFGRGSEEYAQHVAALESQFRVDVQVEPVTTAVVYDLRPRLRVTLCDRVGREHTIEIDMVGGRSEIPDTAVVCGHSERPLALDPARGIVCATCAPPCDACGIGATAVACSSCRKEGRTTCYSCCLDTEDGPRACPDHSYACSGGERRLRPATASCGTCGHLVCSSAEHRAACAGGHESHCAACAAAAGVRCALCREWACRKHMVVLHDATPGCPACSETCRVDGRIHRGNEGATCAVEGHTDDGWTCAGHLVATTCGHGAVCPEHAVASAIDGAMVCAHCSAECSVCGRTVAVRQTSRCDVGDCPCRVCSEHAAMPTCAICGRRTCVTHAKSCAVTASALCIEHAVACRRCGGIVRSDASVQCEQCMVDLCPRCRRDGKDGAVGCAECMGPCSEDAALYVRSTLVQCADAEHAPPALFCPEHATTCTSCSQGVCSDHLESSDLSHDVLCRTCVRLCAECGLSLAPSEARACAHCGNVYYCDYAEPAPRCAEGGEVACREHCAKSEGGAWICSRHRRECGRCGRLLEPDQTERCSAAREPLCPAHTLACAHDGHPVCEAHAMRSEGGLLVCTAHAVPCAVCGVVLDPSDSVRCVVGSESLCRRHRLQCVRHEDEAVCEAHSVTTRGGRSLARSCVRSEMRCSTAHCVAVVLDDEATACTTCGRRACSTHERACDACGGKPCPTHRAAGSRVEVLCDACIRHCSGCPERTILSPGDVVQCAVCGNHACREEHARACSVDDVSLCAACAVESPVDRGWFHRQHLVRCSSCGQRALVRDPERGFCGLCALLRTPGRSAEQPPFNRSLAESYIRRHAGLLRGRADVRWFSHGKQVVLWVRSGLLRRDALAVYDRQGRLIEGVVPKPPGSSRA